MARAASSVLFEEIAEARRRQQTLGRENILDDHPAIHPSGMDRPARFRDQPNTCHSARTPRCSTPNPRRRSSGSWCSRYSNRPFGSSCSRHNSRSVDRNRWETRVVCRSSTGASRSRKSSRSTPTVPDTTPPARSNPMLRTCGSSRGRRWYSNRSRSCSARHPRGTPCPSYSRSSPTQPRSQVPTTRWHDRPHQPNPRTSPRRLGRRRAPFVLRSRRGSG